MDANDVLALGLGVTPPWRLVSQRLDTATQPNQLHLEVAAERGALFPCPTCGKLCKAHDFAEFTWRQLLPASLLCHRQGAAHRLPRRRGVAD